MKTKIYKTSIQQIIILVAVSSFFIFTSSCKKDSSDSTPQNTAIKTYSGDAYVTEGSYAYTDLIDLSFEPGSDKKGTFFRKGTGDVGIFSGTTSGNVLTINGSMKDNSSSVFSGTIQILNDSLMISLTGTAYSETYTYSGTLHLQECINIADNYYVQDSVTFTITMDGETETNSENGYGYITLNQADCHVSYDVPGTDVTRDGEIDGNKLVLTGPFIIPASSDVNITENSFKATVIIIDNYHFEYSGTGNAKGTYMGNSFVIKGTSKG
jgi:hypothetical protein